MPEIECTNCGWRGMWLQRDHGLCPECSQDEFIDLDAVTESDYIEQNPLEVPKE